MLFVVVFSVVIFAELLGKKKMQGQASSLKNYQLNFLISYIWFLNWPF